MTVILSGGKIIGAGAAIFSVGGGSAPTAPPNLLLINQGGPNNAGAGAVNPLSNYQGHTWQDSTPGSGGAVASYEITRDGSIYASVTTKMSFQGYISNGTSGTPGTVLTVTSGPTGGAANIVGNLPILAASIVANTSIMLQNTGTPGQTGTYTVNISQALGTSGSPVTFSQWYYEDTAATGSNIIDLSAAATIHTYSVKAVDVSSNKSASSFPKSYIFSGQTWANFADFSGAPATNTFNDTSGSPVNGPFDMKWVYGGSGQILPVIAPPIAQGANGFPNNFEIGAFAFMIMDVKITDSQFPTTQNRMGITSRIPPGDAFCWVVNNLWDYGTPILNTWVTIKIPYVNLHMGTTTATCSLVGTSNTNTFGVPGGTGTLTVSVCSAPNFVDNTMYITSGAPAGTYIQAVGQNGSVGTFTVLGPNISLATNVSSTTMTFQRSTWYKSGFQNNPDITTTMYVNNLGVSTV